MPTQVPPGKTAAKNCSMLSISRMLRSDAFSYGYMKCTTLQSDLTKVWEDSLPSGIPAGLPAARDEVVCSELRTPILAAKVQRHRPLQLSDRRESQATLLRVPVHNLCPPAQSLFGRALRLMMSWTIAARSSDRWHSEITGACRGSKLPCVIQTPLPLLNAINWPELVP